MKYITAIAPVNIAVIKYWGKRDEELVLPLNGSISATLDSDHMCAKTTVAIDASFQTDRLWLNGKEEKSLSKRLQRVLKEVRSRASTNESGLNPNWNIHICSINNFPTAAGLASSAAGFACLVFALSKLFNVQDDCSGLARQGSGSACRSMFGGWVEWQMGERSDGRDSVAKQLASCTHWADMAVLIVVTNTERKEISSTEGMRLSTQTSEFLKHRSGNIVPQRLQEMKEFIKKTDFEGFATLTMKDSNNMHAVLLDTHPPIHYLSSTSHHIIKIVHALNQYYNRNVVSYTFDAGPNACLFAMKNDLVLILSLLSYYYPPIGEDEFITGNAINLSDYVIDSELLEGLNSRMQPMPGAVSYIINTQIGEGPRVLDDVETLLNPNDGLPIITN